MVGLDPLIHAPTRLQVVTTLSAVSEAEFATLRAVLEVSDSVLSKHVSALADAGYVRSRKGVQVGRRCRLIPSVHVATLAAAIRAIDDVRHSAIAHPEYCAGPRIAGCESLAPTWLDQLAAPKEPWISCRELRTHRRVRSPGPFASLFETSCSTSYLAV